MFALCEFCQKSCKGLEKNLVVTTKYNITKTVCTEYEKPAERLVNPVRNFSPKSKKSAELIKAFLADK